MIREAKPNAHPLSLFEGYGIELEYMIVSKETLNVLPITDKVMEAVVGSCEPEVIQEDISWNNELALHVIEFKTTKPTNTLTNLHLQFQRHVNIVNELLAPFGGMLMPTGMHPWMDPSREMRLWPHESQEIYEAFHRIFDCHRHGWANLQSVHLNLPFATDEEFGKLHSAIRTLLPILPALAASSPITEGCLTPFLDNRLNVYQSNSSKIPSITGKVVPEVSLSSKDYHENILAKMYRDIAPLDPGKVLQHEWLNSRGAIARFDRQAIEIRLLDTQECPLADLAIIEAAVVAIRALVEEKWVSVEALHQLPLDLLHTLFLACIKEGEKAIIANQTYLKVFGLNEGKPRHVKEVWEYLITELCHNPATERTTQNALEVILREGPLARRIQKRYQNNPSHQNLQGIYSHLCVCLHEGKLFQ